MKINYLSSSDLHSGQANVVHVLHMCNAMKKLGHEPLLFCQSPVNMKLLKEQFGDLSEIKIVSQKPSQLRLLGGVIYALRVFLSTMKLPDPDLWYGRHIYSVLFVALMGKPFILELHGIHRKKIVRWIVNKMVAFSNFKGLVVISSVLRNDCIKTFRNLIENKVIVAHDGAPIFFDQPGLINKTPGVLDVGYTGHLYPGKGMEIIRELAQKVKHVRFHVVGGTEKDIKYWKAHNLSNNIIMHGYVSHEKIAGYLSSFDVVLLPNKEKVLIYDQTEDIGKWTSPLKMFEYMSSGTAILASNVEVLKEVLEDGKTALFCDPNKIDDWVNAIELLESSIEKRRELGENARKVFEENYTWEKRTELIFKTLKILGAKSKTSR